MPKRSAEDEDGPEQKLARTSQQDGQAQGPLRKVSLQVPPPVPLSLVQKVQMFADACTETIWTGTLEFQNSQFNDQRQALGIISCKILHEKKVTTAHWPKHLKMTTITEDDYMASLDKVSSPGLSTRICARIFSVDGDCDKKSHGAFMQYTSRPHMECVALLEYSSSGIQVLFVRSWILQGEKITVGFIKEYSNNDCTVKLLTDLGILSHATAYNVLAKENSSLKKKLKEKNKEVSSLKEELKQKDKQEVELALHYQEEIRTLNQIAEKNSREKDALVMERDQNQRRIDTQEREIERLKNETERERTKIMAESWRNQERIRNEVKAEQTKESLKFINKLKKIKNKYSELENEACSIKQAILDEIEKEFFCTICQDTLTKAQTLNCGHSFCTNCIEDRRMHTNDGKEWPCPNCVQTWTTNVPSMVIDSCIEKIDKLKKEGTGETESEGEPMSVGSDDESTPASSPSSSGSSSSSFCRNPSSIENMLSPASSSDSDWTEET